MPTHSFTGEKVSFTYPRVLQIAGGIIYDGLGETVSIADINITNPSTGSTTGPQGYSGATGSVGGFTIIYNTTFNAVGFTSSYFGMSDPDFTYGDMYISFFDKSNTDLTSFYTELKNVIDLSSPSQTQYVFLKIFSTTDSTQFGLYRILISGIQLYSDGVYIYHTNIMMVGGNIIAPSEIGLSFLLNPGDQGYVGDTGADGSLGSLSIPYLGSGYASGTPGFISQYINYDQDDFTIPGTLNISKNDASNNDNFSFFNAIITALNISSPSGTGTAFLKIFSTLSTQNIMGLFSFTVSDVSIDANGLVINNLTFIGGNLTVYTDPVSIGFLLNAGDAGDIGPVGYQGTQGTQGVQGSQGSTGPSGTEESKITSLVASGTPITIATGMSASFLWQNVYDVGTGWTYSYVKEGYSDRYFAIGTGFNDSVYCIKQQSDGKVWVGGNFTTYNDIALNDWSGGSITSNKLILLDDQGRCLINFTDGFSDIVKDIEINSEGYVLVGGNFTSFNSSTASYFIGLNTDGTVYSYFDGFNDFVNVTKVQPDGKVLVGGNFTSYGTYSCNRLIRFNTDMTVDYDFYINMSIGAGSEAESAFNHSVNDISFQSDGSIIVSGKFSNFSSVYAGHLVKLNPDGTINSDFYNNLGGNVSNNGYDYELFKAQSQSDNKIVVLTEDKTNFMGSSIPQYLSRLNADGTLDTTFNYDSGSPINTISHVGNDLIILPDDSIIIGGNFTYFNTIIYGNINVNYIAKTDRNGNLDQEFNQALYGGFNNYVNTLYLQNDGKILVGGEFGQFIDGYSTTESVKLIRLQSSVDGIYIPETSDYVVQYKIAYQTSVYHFSGPFATIMINDKPINSTNRSLPILSNLSNSSDVFTGELTDFKILSLSKDDKISINIFNLNDTSDFTNADFTVIDSGIKVYDGLSNFSSLSIYKAKNGSNGLITGTGYGNGYQGYRGLQGIQGPKGNQGLIGSTGDQGSQGVQGTQGFQGVQGIQGFQGVQGTQGYQGPQGNQGLIGSTGAQGIPGTGGLTFSGTNTELAYFNSSTGLTSSSRMIFDGTNLIIGSGSAIIGGTLSTSKLQFKATSNSTNVVSSYLFNFISSATVSVLQFGDFGGAGDNYFWSGQVNPSSTNYIIRAGSVASGINYLNAPTDLRLSVGATNYMVMTSGSGVISIRKPTVMFTATSLTLTAGTTTVAPLLFQTGVTMSATASGSMEYNGTNLFFTRAVSSNRENILMSSATSSVTLTSPNVTLTVNVGGQTYYLQAKATND